MSGFRLQRLGLLIEPEPGNPHEVEGILNPATVRGPDGQLYLFPRLVRRVTIRASASLALSSTNLAIRAASSGLGLRSSLKSITSGDLTAAAVARTRGSHSWNGSSVM
jgi:hypothetical protein